MTCRRPHRSRRAVLRAPRLARRLEGPVAAFAAALLLSCSGMSRPAPTAAPAPEAESEAACANCGDGSCPPTMLMYCGSSFCYYHTPELFAPDAVRPLPGAPTDPGTEVVVETVFTDSDCSSVGFVPKGIRLDDGPTPEDWIVPPPSGRRRLHGTHRLGEDTELLLLLDEEEVGRVVFRLSWDGSRDLTALEPLENRTHAYRLEHGGGGPVTKIQVPVAYGGGQIETVWLGLYVLYMGDAEELGDRDMRLGSYAAGCRVGRWPLGAESYRIELEPTGIDGLYSDPTAVSFGVDLDGDGRTRGVGETFGAARSFQVENRRYRVASISAAGDRVTLAPSRPATLAGRVLQARSRRPVPRATVSLRGTEHSVETAVDGSYSLTVPEGEYDGLDVEAEGLLPAFRHEVLLPGDRETRLDVALDRPRPIRSGALRLERRRSFHFASGRRYPCRGGEFHLARGNDRKLGFWANRPDQRGLTDLGDLGDQALEDVDLGGFGAAGRGAHRADVVLGHTYVSLARRGEEGHFVVFRVTAVDPELQWVDLRWLYR